MKRIEPIAVGIWGLGRAGWNMHCRELDRFAAYFRPVAACDLIADRAEQFAARYPGSRAYTDGDAFLRDPEVELVAVAVRSKQHVEYTFRALEAGKRVFLEKPVALDYADALRLAEYAKAHPGFLFFRQNRRFEACFNHVREIIGSGILGRVFQIKLCRHEFSLRDDWQTLTAEGGGQLNNWGPHLVDHALRLLESPVAEVWSDLKRVAARGDAEDQVKIIVRGENDRIVEVEISGGVLIPSPVYTVYGTRGALVSWDESEIRLKYLDETQELPAGAASAATPPWNGSGHPSSEALRWVEKSIPVAPAVPADLEDIYGRLYQAIREKAEFPVTPDQVAENMRVIELVHRQQARKGGVR